MAVSRPVITEKLGEGSYGRVTGNDKHAIKAFDNMENLTAEVFVTRYVSTHCGRHVIRLKRLNFGQLTMSTERWHCSLQDVLWKGEKLSVTQSRAIFRSLLRAVADIEALRVVHADIKPGNIFLSADRMNAVLGDFGVSSISGSARVSCTTKQYSSSQYANYRAHDCFSVVIVGLQLLCGYRLLPDGFSEYRSKSSVRADINRLVSSSADKEALLGLIHDDPRKCWSAEKVLEKMYCEFYRPERPRKLDVYDHNLSDLSLQITYHVDRLCTLYKVKRANRCKACCNSMLGRLPVEIPVLSYITAIVYIFRCVFGFTQDVHRSERMQLINALEYCNESLHNFAKVLDTIIRQKDVIDLMFYF